ncbi:Fungalysin metallopeptidase-domain-containing protein [Dimargaris cristalligena]|uniref:Extracellular metalloproteinase n=1 Tax=Dimargaris cristalligena TaxID=215637 RepID=A0A4V1J4X4_9FUNG|nr:Fungalysin metallopeptidase-domain-containing protein [Dimargaris cristalligena]|eukprot:RKP37069.1 Fungalysin metallopeptidase-domain-containing protein [Dimargaris cristalligena]
MAILPAVRVLPFLYAGAGLWFGALHPVAGKRLGKIASFGPSLSYREYQILDSEPSMSAGFAGDSGLGAFATSPFLGDPSHGSSPGLKRLQDHRRQLTGPRTQAETVAVDFAQQRFQLSTAELFVSSSVDSNFGASHVYLRQLVNGLPLQNGVMNVNVASGGEILSFGSSFTRPGSLDGDTIDDSYSSPPLRRRSIESVQSSGALIKGLTPVEAFIILAEHIGYQIEGPDAIQVDVRTVSEIPLLFEYTITNITAAELDPAYEVIVCPGSLVVEVEAVDTGFTVQFYDGEVWLEGFVSTSTRQVRAITNWAADASYRVFPMGTISELDGPRQLVVEPEDHVASPVGWSTQLPTGNASTTDGNNVHAQENWSGKPNWKKNYRPQVSNTRTFDFPLVDPQDRSNSVDAAVTNLFYWCNLMHDIFYHYGFDEGAGNFQDDNFGRGGTGQDAVVAFAQMGSGHNSAVFVTPPDGRQPVMRMYLWDKTGPLRDGALSSDIIIHEYTHGVSTRLTGGRLPWARAGGDFFAVIFHLNAKSAPTQPIVIGAYVTNGAGLRPYPYTTDLARNPATYTDVYRSGSPFKGSHENGLIWASMLYEVYWNLVAELGFTPDWHSASLEHGNTLAVMVVVAGMKFQPCYPTFIQARDAILQAESTIAAGAYKCAIWRGFAKRGLGTQASYLRSRRTADFSVPPECQ